jgi:hypothetical protein
MIDNFVLALTHGLMLIVAWRLLSRPDLDDPDAPVQQPGGPSRRWAGFRRETNSGTADGA